MRVISRMRSASVDLPWSMWAMIEKLRLRSMGGDEFAALLAVAGDDEALEAGDRLRAAVVEADLGLTVSIGVAVPVDGESDATLVGRADRALYGVKARGRDGVGLA